MLESFKDNLLRNCEVQTHHRIILAVSGGIDSMVMTGLFTKLENKVLVAHCNFRLRGEESDRDESFVRDYCNERNLEFVSTRFDTASYAEENKISIQMAARELRYDWFEQLRSVHGYDFIATAHNRDDQVETFFVNLVRGTGIRGLSGIPQKTGSLIRPLLNYNRESIHDYALKEEIDWREDSSNASVYYKRNKIRHEILPLLRELNPGFDRVMEANIRNLTKAREIYSRHIDERKEFVLRRDRNNFIIDISSLQREEFSDSLLYEILTDFNFNPSTIQDIFNNLENTSGKKFYSDSHRLVKDREELIIESLRAPNSLKHYIEMGQEEFSGPVRLQFSYHDPASFAIPTFSDIACLDAAKLVYPLILRKWMPGDYFQPLGMENTKKLSDFFVDNKFSIPQKENTWLLCSGQDIVWVIGHRIDDRYKITRETREILRVELMDI